MKIKHGLTTNKTKRTNWFCLTNHSLTMVFALKLWLYKWLIFVRVKQIQSAVFMCYDCLWMFRSSADDANPAGAPGAPGGPGGAGPPPPPPNTTSNRRLQQTQAQVEEVSECLWTRDIRISYGWARCADLQTFCILFFLSL